MSEPMDAYNTSDDDAAAAEGSPSSAAAFFDFKRVNPTRSLICFGLGAVIGLGIAGVGLFTARGTATHVVPPENVALINRRPILRTDFIAQTETEYKKPYGETTMAERLKILNDMVREELFVQRALELDMPGTDPDTRSALVAAVEQQVVADVTTHQPSDEELQRYFEEHRSGYASEGLMTLHHMLLRPAPDAMAQALKAVAALRAGTALADVTASFGLREVVVEHTSPEQFYFAEKIHLGDALFALALTLDSGDVGEPLAADDGIHILQMVRNERPVPRTFAQARGEVLNDYSAAAKRKLEDADERYLRDKADILIADDYADAYETAQAEKSAEAKKQAEAAARKP